MKKKHEGYYKDLLGLPWGCTVQPLSKDLLVSVPYEGAGYSTQLARCSNCLAYINHLVTYNERSWVCSLCLLGFYFFSIIFQFHIYNYLEYQENSITAEQERYHTKGSKLLLPELTSAAIDFFVEEPITNNPSISDLPIYVFIVDVSSAGSISYFSAQKYL